MAFACTAFACFALVLSLTGEVLAARLDVGDQHSCALTGDGHLKCWGQNSYYGLGDGTQMSSERPVDVLGLEATVTDVAAGSYFSCALTTEGAVKCWGYNGSLQVGDGSTGYWVEQPSTVVGLNAGVQAIAAGANHACALTSTGGVKCWGGNPSGGLGDGTMVGSGTPVDVVGLQSNVVAIDAGLDYTCALTAAGGMKCWGNNQTGQLGDGTSESRLAPVDVFGLNSGVVRMATGWWHTCAVMTSGRVKCWGANGAGALGDGTYVPSQVPVEASTLQTAAAAVAVARDFTCALAESGGVECWGVNWRGGLGDGTMTSRPVAAGVTGLESGVVELATDSGHACARSDNDVIRCWGDGSWGQLGNDVPFRHLHAVPVEGLVGQAVGVAAADAHTCALTADGGVACWGENYGGELGDGSTLPRLRPVPVEGMQSGARAVATGYAHSCAVTVGDSAYCWGWNALGQIGDGNYANHAEPVAVLGMEANTAALSLGSTHTCALTLDGAVKCWGSNSAGELGNGTFKGSAVPVQVSGLEEGVVGIDVGNSHSCALTSAGGVKCWGENSGGALGDGTTIDRSTPADVVGLEAGVIAISGGEWRTCAVTEVGGVKCWGDFQLIPRDVVGLEQPATAVSVGGGHICALATTGGLQCWGFNTYGQLGDGTLSTTDSPVGVWGMEAGVVAVNAGANHTCAVTAAGEAKCWGSNRSGQLGNGEAGYALTPQVVAGTPFSSLIFRDGFDR